MATSGFHTLALYSPECFAETDERSESIVREVLGGEGDGVKVFGTVEH